MPSENEKMAFEEWLERAKSLFSDQRDAEIISLRAEADAARAERDVLRAELAQALSTRVPFATVERERAEHATELERLREEIAERDRELVECDCGAIKDEHEDGCSYSALKPTFATPSPSTPDLFAPNAPARNSQESPPVAVADTTTLPAVGNEAGTISTPDPAEAMRAMTERAEKAERDLKLLFGEHARRVEAMRARCEGAANSYHARCDTGPYCERRDAAKDIRDAIAALRTK